MRDGKLDRLSIELLGENEMNIEKIAPEARNDLKGGRHEDQN